MLSPELRFFSERSDMKQHLEFFSGLFLLITLSACTSNVNHDPDQESFEQLEEDLSGNEIDHDPIIPGNIDLEQEYSLFNQFCLDSFGAEKDELTYEAHGNAIGFFDSGFWVHESVNSVAVGFETNLPSLSYVEYGPTNAYGQKTTVKERPFYLHLHHIQGLDSDTTYHYRLIAQDERGNTIASDDATFRTQTIEGKIAIPGMLEGPPYNLDEAGSTYVLTEDITSDTRGFTFAGQDITLDLNGHTLTFDNGTPLVSGETWSVYQNSPDSSFGIIGLYSVSGAILNGSIIQGQTNSTGDIGHGFNPIYLAPHDSSSLELAGLSIEYAGDSVAGILVKGSGPTLNIHHNVVQDNGTGIDNRHQGIRAIAAASSNGDIHHNLIKRSRHQALVMGGDARANELYVDSWATNSYGIGPGTASVIERNRLFGTGYHNVAIGFPLGGGTITVRNNFIFLQGDAPNTRSDEYSEHASVNGIRLTQYGGESRPHEDHLYENNVIIVKGRNGTQQMRGVQFFSDPYVSNLVFRNNIVKTEVMDEATTAPASCIVGQGLAVRHADQLPIYYEGNRFISNSLNIRLGDSYGVGGNHQFRNNRFEKFGNRSDYHTIQIGYWDLPSYGNLFIDNEVSGGADLADNLFVFGEDQGNESPITPEESVLNYSVGHSLYVQAQSGGTAIANATISIHDNTGTTFEGTTDENGRARLELLEKTYELSLETSFDDIEIEHSLHEVRIDGYAAIEVDLDTSSTEDSPQILSFL